LLPNETYYVENIKYTNFILDKNTKSTNLRIHELVSFNQITKIDAHGEKYFHSICNMHIYVNRIFRNCDGKFFEYYCLPKNDIQSQSVLIWPIQKAIE